MNAIAERWLWLIVACLAVVVRTVFGFFLPHRPVRIRVVAYEVFAFEVVLLVACAAVVALVRPREWSLRFFALSRRSVAISIGAGVVALAVIALLGWLEHLLWPAVPRPQVMGGPFDYALLAIAIIVIGPLSEEIVFRGLVLENLLEQYAPYVAVVVSAIVFALGHEAPQRALDIFGAGIVLGLLYAKTRNVTSTSIAHVTMNGIGMLFMLGAMFEH